MKTELNQEDIDKIRNSAIIVVSKKDKQIILDKISKEGLEYITINNGYMSSMIIDVTKKGIFRYFLSTYNPSGNTDPDIGKTIAQEIIGEGYVIKSRDNFVDFIKEEKRHIDQNERLSNEDIKKVRDSIIVLTDGNVVNTVLGGGLRPVILSNWYKATLSVDVMRENLRLIHLSVSNTIGKTDTKIAENMALDIVGEGFKTVGPMHHPNVIHFMKVEDEKTMIELFSNVREKENREKENREKENRENKGGNVNRENKGGNVNRENKGGNVNREGDIKDGNER